MTRRRGRSRAPPRALLTGLVATLIAVLVTSCAGAQGAASRQVLHISVDGLRGDAIERLGPELLPNFHRLRREGAWTDNARTDPAFTVTLPNHTSQLTGRPVRGAAGHSWLGNGDPGGRTLHGNKGSYVASVFDVVHDHGLATAAYVSKTKFSLFEGSYDEASGARDRTGDDDGRDKIDRFSYDGDTARLVDALLADLEDGPASYTFVHLLDPDSAGHYAGWEVRAGSPYAAALERVDGFIGEILTLIDSDPALAGTTLILTSDHGGVGRGHGNSARPENYTIPFYVWGAGVGRGDLYALNPGARADPGAEQPPIGAAPPPIRNGDVANLALALLGLPSVPGSSIGAAQDLAVR